MLAYLDSSVLGRAYLADEPGHDAAVAPLADPDVVLVTSTLTRIEVTGLLVRAARAGRCDPQLLLAALRADLGDGVRVRVPLAAPTRRLPRGSEPGLDPGQQPRAELGRGGAPAYRVNREPGERGVGQPLLVAHRGVLLRRWCGAAGRGWAWGSCCYDCGGRPG
ncbi:MAG: hypothetical protein ACR2K2_01400 [Mycobacteriales bacterium]